MALLYSLAAVWAATSNDFCKSVRLVGSGLAGAEICTSAAGLGDEDCGVAAAAGAAFWATDGVGAAFAGAGAGLADGGGERLGNGGVAAAAESMLELTVFAAAVDSEAAFSFTKKIKKT